MLMLKKILTHFFYPLPLCLGILVLGLVFLWATKRQRLGKALVTWGTVLLVLLGSHFLSPVLLGPLESQYPPLLNAETVLREGGRDAAGSPWIVVLGGGIVSDPALPPNSQLALASLARVVEGVRLYRALPGSRLLLSGGACFDPVPEAVLMAQVARLLGAAPQDVVLETESRDTADQAAIIAKILDRQPVILVTSAAHMPRALRLFANQGLHPVPAPTDYKTGEPAGFNPLILFPDSGALCLAQDAIHEYLGLAWAWVRGRR
jgi:uncharacterized SAM-binding protein YcdF (DUF218 family)